MNVQVTIKIDRESITELAEVFKEIISGAPCGQQPMPGQADRQMPQPDTQAPQGMQPQVPQASQPVPLAQPTQQNAQVYSAQIAQKTQLPPEAVTGGAAPAQTAVPTASHTYTPEELARAAMPLMERGMMPQLQELLAGYGVEAIPDLPAEYYGNFATALRGMGAQI